MATPPITTAFGALLSHITLHAVSETFQPMNVNFGLMPVPEDIEPPRLEDGTPAKGKQKLFLRKRNRQKAYTHRADADFNAWNSAL